MMETLADLIHISDYNEKATPLALNRLGRPSRNTRQYTTEQTHKTQHGKFCWPVNNSEINLVFHTKSTSVHVNVLIFY